MASPTFGFYGGRTGASYKIVAHYDSVYDMVTAFQGGGAYNDVQYGEYVIIDTIVNKNEYSNPENGLLYRRGFNYQERFNPNNLTLTSHTDAHGQPIYTISREDYQDMESYRSDFSALVKNPGGGAEYIGQIVGPQGQAPITELVGWAEFDADFRDNAENKKKEATLDSTPGATFNENGDLDGTVDTIKYGYITVRDGFGNVIGAKLSFDIPYSVFKMSSESITPYEEGYAEWKEDHWEYTNLITEKEESQGHPYYWYYDLKVPHGIHGQDVSSVGVNQTGSFTPEGEVDNEDHNYQFYYETRNYDRTPNPKPERTYIDSYLRTIYHITDNSKPEEYNILLERSTFYEPGAEVRTLDMPEGLVLYAYLGGTTSADPIDIDYSTVTEGMTIDDGRVEWHVVQARQVPPSMLTIHYTHGANDDIAIRLLDKIIVNDNDGRIYAKYTDLNQEVPLGEFQSILAVDYIDRIGDVPVDRLRITYNTYLYDETGRIIDEKYYPNSVYKERSEFQFNEDGTVKLYPTVREDGHKVRFVEEPFKLVRGITVDPMTKDVELNYTDGTKDVIGKIRSVVRTYITGQDENGLVQLDKPHDMYVEYNDAVDGVPVADKLNQQPFHEIAATQTYGDNLVVLYADPRVRKAQIAAGATYYTLPIGYFPTPGYTCDPAGDDGNGLLYWINLGPILTSEHIFGAFESLNDLVTSFPNGFGMAEDGSNINRAGWIATVKEVDGNGDYAYALYAYDYAYGSGWFRIQGTTNATFKPELAMVVADRKGSETAKLNLGGWWFVETDGTEIVEDTTGNTWGELHGADEPSTGEDEDDSEWGKF